MNDHPAISKMKRAAKNLRRGQAANQSGIDFEFTWADFIGGIRHKDSKGGDVEADGVLWECKLRRKATGIQALANWINGAKRDAAKLGLKWAIALTFNDGLDTYVVMPASEYKRLSEMSKE